LSQRVTEMVIGHLKFSDFFRRLVPMNMDFCFRRNEGGRRPNRSGAFQQRVTPGPDPASMSYG
jgi:hypothetical protein